MSRIGNIDMAMNEEKETMDNYTARGWLQITAHTTNFQPPLVVDEEEWSTYFVFLKPTDKTANAVCQARSNEAARAFAFSPDGANLTECTIWKHTARLLGTFDNAMGFNEKGFIEIDIKDFEDDMDTPVYIGYVIDRKSAEGHEYTYDEFDEIRRIIEKAVDDASLPGVLDNWHSWRDDGAYYIGTAQVCLGIYDVFCSLPENLGVMSFVGLPPEFYEMEGNDPRDYEKWFGQEVDE